jgi:hypothetical protein
MNQPRPSKTETPDVEADERHRDEVDAFISRNRVELNASIRRSRAELAKGVQSDRTVADIAADGRKRHGAR